MGDNKLSENVGLKWGVGVSPIGPWYIHTRTHSRKRVVTLEHSALMSSRMPTQILQNGWTMHVF